jgi:rubrerythrin
VEGLPEYIWKHYRELLTPEEELADLRLVLLAEAAAPTAVPHATDPQMVRDLMARTAEEDRQKAARLLREVPGVDSPPVVALLADGEAAFRRRAAERVVRDHPMEVVLNRCPQCSVLCRTPTAKQCPRCGHSWRGKKPAEPGVPPDGGG